MNGYVSEFRVSNVARWTSNFTPPTAPYSSFTTHYYQAIQQNINKEPDISPTYWEVYSTPPTLYLKSQPNFITPQANNGYTHTHGNTPAITTSYAIQPFSNGGYEAQCGLQHQHIFTGATSSVAIPNPAWVSFRLWEALLGKMTTWNNAVTTDYTNGLYYSPPLNLNVATFGELLFNASKLPTDSINFYFNSASTMAGLDGLTPTFATSTFTLASHGLVNGGRVSIADPNADTNLLTTVMYYVVSATTNTFQVSLSGGSPVAFTGTGSTGVTVYPWFDEISGNDVAITITPNVWVSFVIEFIAANTTISNPTLITANEFIMEFSYSRSGTIAETAVEFVYTTGRLNAGEPMMDKIYKRIASDHTGTQGQVQVQWATENSNNVLTFDLALFPSKWASFFQDTAMGESINVTYYKNDLYDFNLRIFKLQFTPQPILY
jgi:hypothetical protein